MGKQYHRKQFDLGLVGTRNWITRWYGDVTDLEIDAFQIVCPSLSSLDRSDLKQLELLKSRNQSFLHTFLKFAGFRWLLAHSQFPDTIQPEVICYSPIEELCVGQISSDENGHEFEISLPQILYDNIENFPLAFGHMIRIDLHSFDISLEVGGTSPFNLLMPLLDGLVEKAVWIPFPSDASTKDFSKHSEDLLAIRAYGFTLNS